MKKKIYLTIFVLFFATMFSWLVAISSGQAELVNNSSPALQEALVGTVLKNADDYALYKVAGSNIVIGIIGATPASNAYWARIASNSSNAIYAVLAASSSNARFAVLASNSSNALTSILADYATLAANSSNAQFTILASNASNALTSILADYATLAASASNAQFAVLASNSSNAIVAVQAYWAQIASNSSNADLAIKAGWAEITSNASNAQVAIIAGWTEIASNSSNAIWSDGTGTFGGELADFFTNRSNHYGQILTNDVADLDAFIQVYTVGALLTNGSRPMAAPLNCGAFPVTNANGFYGSGLTFDSTKLEHSMSSFVVSNTAISHMGLSLLISPDAITHTTAGFYVSNFQIAHSTTGFYAQSGLTSLGNPGTGSVVTNVSNLFVNNYLSVGKVDFGTDGVITNLEKIHGDASKMIYMDSIILNSSMFLSNVTTIYGIFKRGANQGASGAVSNEIWVDTNDQTLKLGI